MIKRETPPYQTAATTVLAAMTGFLLGLPIAPPSTQGALLLLAFSVFGAFVGYRRRHSRPFFYVSALSVLLLSSLFARDGMKRGSLESSSQEASTKGGESL
ncbi:MAG: hypothetical protein KDD64_09930 [Bdellovibrionales bacterium]|nr:hypothetical protein [Bdellovibrionales bacterium]